MADVNITLNFRGKKDDSSGEEDNVKIGKKKLKTRFICITQNDGKIQLHYIQRKKGRYEISRTWNSADIKSIEDNDDCQIIINMGKNDKWLFENTTKKNDLLYALITICQLKNESMPKLINVKLNKIKENISYDITPLIAESIHKSMTIAESQTLNEIQKSQILETPVSVQPEIQLEKVLADLNWEANADAAALETKLNEEITALEAGNIHAIISSQEQSNTILEQISSTLNDLDQIDQWLSHHIVLLNKMGQDVHQVELQNKDMQVGSENQKILKATMEKLMSSIHISGSVIEILLNEPLDQVEGVRECVKAVKKLVHAIDIKDLGEMGEMLAVKERIAQFRTHAKTFAKRVSDYLELFFKNQSETYFMDKNRLAKKGLVKLIPQEQKEIKMFEFFPLLEWLKEFEEGIHVDLQLKYVNDFSKIYQREINEFLDQLRICHLARKEDIIKNQSSYTFYIPTVSVTTAATHAIKTATKNMQNSSAVGGIIKQKLEGWRPGYKSNKLEVVETPIEIGQEDTDLLESKESLMDDGERWMPDELLAHCLLKILYAIIREQNFFMDAFSITAFSEGVSIKSWQESLTEKRGIITEERVQRKINGLLERVFDGVFDKIFSLTDLILKFDQSFSVGMMVSIEINLEMIKDSSYVFITNLCDALYKRLAKLFEKFIDEQIKAIEETKVTARKRKGILPFFQTFPLFLDRIEGFFMTENAKTHALVEKAYTKIIKSMFETLEAVAVLVDQDSKIGSDEKEYINLQIMTVENMHHFYSKVRARKVPCLDLYVKQAKAAYDLNMETYCKIAIKKPLGKIFDFFDGIEGLLKTRPAEEVSYHLQYSKTAIKDVIKKYPNKEIKKGLENLYKRVEKQFIEDGLLQVAWRGIQEAFYRQVRRYEELIGKCYPESNIRLEFSLEEVIAAFSEIAQSH